MQLTSLEFAGTVAATLVAFRVTRVLLIRLSILLAASLLFIASQLPTWQAGWAISLFVATCFCAIHFAWRFRSTAVLAACISSIVLAFICLKYCPFGMDRALPPFVSIGLSYLLFRFLHIVIDAGQGQLEERPRALPVLTYALYFPAFLSGPVHRFDDFIHDLSARKRLKSEDIHFASDRILSGLINTMLFAPIAFEFFGYFSKNALALNGDTELRIPLIDLTPDFTLTQIPLIYCALAASTLYTIFLYLNFSGYTSIVIGISRLFGIALPENFNRPFTAANVSEFWSRWHMSLSEWFKTYLFTPLYMFLSSVAPARSLQLPIALICLFSSFLIIGIWHGTSLSYFYYGVYLGAAAVLHRLYQAALGALLGKKRFRLIANSWAYRSICRGIVFLYFSVALFLFWIPADKIFPLANAIRQNDVWEPMIFWSIGSTVGLISLDLIVYAYRYATTYLLGERITVDMQIAAKAVIFLAITSLFASSPTFVYQGY